MSEHKRPLINVSVRNDFVGELTPHVFESGALDRPQGPNRENQGNGSFQIAPWLPVVWQDTVSNDWFVLSTGKAVCLSNDGFVVPAGLKETFELTYTSNDYDQQTLDITTGEVYAVDGTTSYDAADILAALQARGLLSEDASAATEFLSRPVGAILGDVYASFSNGDATNPVKLKKLNYVKEKGIMFTTANQVKLPWVPAVIETVEVGSKASAALALEAAEAGKVFVPSEVTPLQRYSSVTSSTFFGISLGVLSVAKNTSRTPITSNNALLANEKFASMQYVTTKQEAIGVAIDSLKAVGDFFVDLEVGMVFVYAANPAAALPALVSAAEITFYSYTESPATVTRYASATGDLKPGDYLKVDANSNYTKWVDGTDDLIEIVGRVYSIITEGPNDLLDRVHTVGNYRGDTNAKMQMTGSASGGHGTQVRYAGAADKKIHAVLSFQH